MKTRILFLLAAAFLAAPGFVARASDSTPVVAYSAEQSAPVGLLSEAIRRGSSRHEVLTKIGSPGTRLASNVWVYWNYRSNNLAAERRGLDTLILTFSDDRVTDMKIVNSDTLAAALNRRSEGRVAAGAMTTR